MSVQTISTEQLHHALSLRDLSDPAQGPHAMQQVLAGLIAGVKTQTTTVRLERPNPVVTVEDNYTRLRIGPDTRTRESRYTRYVDETRMLRSHTSAHMPALLSDYRDESAVDVMLCVPGLVYRRDQVDRSHVGEPHQLDLWRLTDQNRMGLEDLQALMGAVAQAALPSCDYRTIEACHPYTLGGLQLEVKWEGEWLELAEGGLTHPEVLSASGLDPTRWSGLAMGLGLDRALMLRKRVPDIRYLRSELPAAKRQMLNLDAWKGVSHQPPAVRDISVMVEDEWDEETLGDCLRETLGPAAESLEQVTIESQSLYCDLPATAVSRMGARPGQTNLLVRLVLRSLDSTLTKKQAADLRDACYLAIHRGDRNEGLHPSHPLWEA